MAMRLTTDRSWQEEWKEHIRHEARSRVPAWLANAQNIERLRKIKVALVATTKLRARAKNDVRTTRELVTSAVRWFCGVHGYPPQVVALNPLRQLTITGTDFFAVECDDLGCYTVEVRCDASVAVNAAKIRGKKYAWSEGVEHYYL